MRKILIAAMLILPAICVVNANNKDTHTTIESITHTKSKVFKVSLTDGNLKSEANLKNFEEIYEQLITYVEQENETHSFKSVVFSTEIDENKKEIVVSNIQFHDENSFAVGLARIFEVNHSTTKEIDIDGIAIEGTASKHSEDLKQASVLAKAVIETINSNEFTPNAKIVSSIDLNYQVIE